MNEDFGIKKSEFNESSLKMNRIHQLQYIINLCSLDKKALFQSDNSFPFGFSNKRNYEVIFECINQLLMEAWAKLTVKEQEKASTIRETLRKALDVLPPYRIVYDARTKNNSIIFVPENYERIIKVLVEYEQEVRILIDKHGFSTRESLDPSSAAFT